MFQASGIIRYSPKMLGVKSSVNWWVVCDVDPEIGKFYRHLFFLSQYRKIRRPAWESHISVVRNEPPLHIQFWEKYSGTMIDLLVDNEKADTNGDQVWFPVKCDFLLDLREELGLSREPFYPFHLTFGNFKD